MTRFYVMSQHDLRRLSSRQRLCSKCGRALKAGDDVVSRYNGRNPSKRWHQKCFNSMYTNI